MIERARWNRLCKVMNMLARRKTILTETDEHWITNGICLFCEEVIRDPWYDHGLRHIKEHNLLAML
jgi:hypothetical protein